MRIPANILHFSEDKKNIPLHNHSDFLYLFKTKPDAEDGDSFMKVGMTEKQTLSGRLDNYSPNRDIALSIFPSKINYIHTEDIRLRETLIKRVFNKHPNIKIYHNQEYFKGPYDLLVKIFRLIGIKDIKHLSNYSDKENASSLLNKILELEAPLEEENMEEFCSDTSSNCSKCGRQFKDKRGVTIHLKVCEGVIPNVICLHCNEHFANPYSLSVHQSRCKVFKKKQYNLEIETNQKTINKLEETQEQNKELQEKLNEIDYKYNQALLEIQSLKSKLYDQLIKTQERELSELRSENKRLSNLIEHKE